MIFKIFCLKLIFSTFLISYLLFYSSYETGSLLGRNIGHWWRNERDEFDKIPRQIFSILFLSPRFVSFTLRSSIFNSIDFFSTFVCPTEIIAFSDRIKEFKNINTEVVACSVDSPFTHLAWLKTSRRQGGLGHLNIPLLSDQTHQISKDYGVYVEDLGHSLR